VVSNVSILFWIAVATTDGKVPSGCGEESLFVPTAILFLMEDAACDEKCDLAVRIRFMI